MDACVEVVCKSVAFFAVSQLIATAAILRFLARLEARAQPRLKEVREG